MKLRITTTKGLVALSIVAMAAAVSAQSRSSFYVVTDLTGVTTNLTGLVHSYTLGNPPVTLKYDNVTYTVDAIFGFWLLDDNDDLTATGGTQNGWDYNENYSGMGGIAGWKTNPPSGTTPPSSNSFTYSSLSGTPNGAGFHFRFTTNFANSGGNTAFVTADGSAMPVPEPVTMVLAASALGLALRRRLRAKA